MDLRAEKPVSAIQIAWASPYATSYQVEYWVGKDALDFDERPTGRVENFSIGHRKKWQGRHRDSARSARAPVATRFLRVLMTESSNTCDVHGSDDVRNCVGYAIQEIHAGSVDANGAFIDVASGTYRQTATYLLFVLH